MKPQISAQDLERIAQAALKSPLQFQKNVLEKLKQAGIPKEEVETYYVLGILLSEIAERQAQVLSLEKRIASLEEALGVRKPAPVLPHRQPLHPRFRHLDL